MFRHFCRLGPGLVLLMAAVGLGREPHAPAGQLLGFHVQDRDFRPVEVAPWVQTQVLQAFVPVEMIDEAAAWGVTVVHGAGPDPYFPLRRDDPHAGPPADQRARVGAFVAKARAHHLRVLVGINPAAPVAIVQAHPQWMICNTSDVQAIHAKAKLDLEKPENAAYRSLGLNTPYGDYLIECLAEIMKDFDVDGFSFDGNYHPPINYAPYEQEQYTQATGRPFPAHADLNDLNYRLYLIWADDQLENWYRRLHDRLRQINPDAAIYTWTTNAGRYGHFLTSPRVMSTRMNRLFDCPIQEWWLDEVNLGSSVVPAFGAAYARAVTGGRAGACEPYIMSRGNPYCGDNFPAHELTVRCLSAFTNGAMTPLSLSAGKEAAEATFKELAPRTPWFIHTTQMPWAAMLVSEQTRQFYAYRDVMGQFLSHCLGVYRAAYEEHLPLNLINDWDINPQILSQYKVLFLPNAACLSDQQAQTIREWVAAGGGLVATCETSLFDELGRPRGDFALKDLFGVSYLGRPTSPATRPALDANFAIVVNDEYWAKRVGYAALRWGSGDRQSDELFADPRLTDYPGGTFKGPAVKISAPAAPMHQTMIMFPNAGAEVFPAGAMGQFGKGRVVYFAVGLDAANYTYALRYMRLLLKKTMQWAANGAFPIQVQAPMCVQSTFFQQKDEKGERIIVHLFNDLNTTDGHGLPENDVPLREETVPIHDIAVRFAGMNIRRFHLEPQGIDLTPQTSGEEQILHLPPLDIHTMLVAERN